MKIFCVATDPSQLGGTFLTWSLHFLSGHEKYFFSKTNQWLDVTHDPLTNRNAHGFDANMLIFSENSTTPAEALDRIKQTVEMLLNTRTNTFHTTYYHSSTEELLNTTVPEYMKDRAEKQILVSGTKYPLYHCKYKTRSPNIFSIDNVPTVVYDPDKIYELFVEMYFKESNKIWQDLQMNNVWDKREFIALNFKTRDISKKIDLDYDYYSIDSMDLWCNFDFGLVDLFDYLELSIDNTRFEHWCKIYHKWKKIHHERLLFVWYFDEIVDSILTNKYMDLKRFNLDIRQEAAIQHELLYQHNLNLKTWQLEKFIDTKQLHSLLEPNIYHKLN